MDDWSSIRLCDVVNLILGGVLFFSPWLFDLSVGAQWQTASIVGIIIAVLSLHPGEIGGATPSDASDRTAVRRRLEPAVTGGPGTRRGSIARANYTRANSGWRYWRPT